MKLLIYFLEIYVKRKCKDSVESVEIFAFGWHLAHGLYKLHQTRYPVKC